MATMRDVAKRASVAAMTVSRVINDPDSVAPETRSRVEQAIADLRYVPNMLGQDLRRQRTRTIALVVSDITNPFAIHQITAVSDAARAAGYAVIFGHTQGDLEEQDRQLRSMIERRVDGIILSPVRNDPEPVRSVRAAGGEIVVLGYRMPGSEVDVVRCDTRSAAAELVDHLHLLGHREIVMLSGPREIVTAAERADGYQDAMGVAGLTAEVHYGSFTVPSGREMALGALRRRPGITAFVTASNFLAIGAARAAAERGLDVPEDLSIVTFDNARLDHMLDPFFTGIVQPVDLMSERATSMLLERIEGAYAGSARDIVLPTVLDVHGSSGPPHGDRAEQDPSPWTEDGPRSH